MGIVAVRRSGTRVATSVRRSQRMSTRYTGRSPSQRTLRAARVGAYAPIPQWPPDARKTFWERFEDDRDLIRLKVVLLTSLALITALLERVA
jgi:hypothetical protein